ncbi:MAG TPA: NUDIX hydrolase [Bryobacteraceae bacterium]|nr:NUDIX hydrolase [Bryobacteraceae bacterium]
MKLISSTELYRCRLFWVTEDDAKDATGYEIKRAIVRHNGSAVMLAVDDKNRVLLVRQYRLPARSLMWELPAGKLDAGESPLTAAKRELIEETGYRARRWKKLVSFYPSPGYVSEKMTVFLATGLTAGEPHPMDDERIQVNWFSTKQVEQMIHSNKIQDGKTIVGYFVWKNLKKR